MDDEELERLASTYTHSKIHLFTEHTAQSLEEVVFKAIYNAFVDGYLEGSEHDEE